MSSSRTLALALALVLPLAARGAGLLDAPIVADALQLLNSPTTSWLATNNGSITIAARVPGDLITDLEAAGVIGDPLYERNFKSVVWDTEDFSFSAMFDASASVMAAPARWLVLDSVKMGAFVWLNGVYLGTLADQFLRYEFDVTTQLMAAGNVLVLTFPPSNSSVNDEARWIACSGAWDWAPYTSTYNSKQAHTMSKGIVRSVYLVGVGAAAIEHLQPRVFYRGAYPTAPLTEATAGPWDVVARVHLRAPAAGATGTIAISSSWGGASSVPVTLPAGNSTVEITLRVPVGQVALWWPNGAGNQTLHDVSATFTPAAGPALTMLRRIGFRFFALVTGNDTDPSTLAGKDGSDAFTMRFNVNGAKIFARGANLIPQDEMEGRYSALAHAQMLRSAADAHFNCLRVWGGGSWYPDVVYDTADELGLLMYHDAMYGQPWFGGNSGVPVSNAMQDAEIRHQLRRLAHHPAIVLLDACNECGGGGLWGSFVSPTMAEEDPSRPIWPACPSSGWKSGVDRLTGLPNGEPLVLKDAPPPLVIGAPRAVGRPAASRAPEACTHITGVDYGHGLIWLDVSADSLGACCDACSKQSGCLAGVLYQSTCYLKNATMTQLPTWASGLDSVWVAGATPVMPPQGGCNTGLELETHGYYQHGEGFATVNSGAALQPFAANLPPALDPTFALGPACPGTFASEFGASAWSSFESVSPTLDSAHWNLHAEPMYERNYAADNFLTSYFNVSWPAGIVALTLQAQLYLALVAQGLLVKSDISTRRARNTFGMCVWQLNEIWPTGGWGGLEYGTVGFTKGQVLGGRWKPLFHLYAQHLYLDLFVTCGADARCLVRNDDVHAAFEGTLVLSLLNVSTSAIIPLNRSAISLGRGAGAATWSCAAGTGSPWSGSCAPWAALLQPLGAAPEGAVLLMDLLNSDGSAAYHSFELLATPAAMAGALSADLSVTAVVGAPAPDGLSVPITVSVSGGGGGAALLVTLTTQAQGRFSENVLMLPSGPRIVHFLAFGKLDAALLASSLRVEHARTYV